MQMSKSMARLCKICGAPALFINFGVLSCSSCKMFFKRHAELDSGSFICELTGSCEINICTRRLCSACRLAKCFACGMQIFLIRGSRFRKNTKRQLKAIGNNTSEQLPTLSLLNKDRSTLSNEQWLLLSNLIHCYDEYSGTLMATKFIAGQNILPPKLRYKMQPVGEFVTANVMQVQRIFERNGNYLSLPIHDRLMLLRNTVKHTGCFGATFILHNSRLLDDSSFSRTAASIFGSHVMSTIKPICNTYDPDIVFVKLILSILAFSTVSFTIYTQTPSINLIDLKSILRIQDTYVELTWRYLLYKYNEEQAIKRFSNLLRCLFNIQTTIVTVDAVQQYSNMIDTVIEQTEDLLISCE